MSKTYADEMVKKRVVAFYNCDNCKKSVKSEEDIKSFHGGHQEWGNDSIESYEYFDVCSMKCYLDIIKRELDEYADQYPSYQIDNQSAKFFKGFYES